MSDSHHHCDHHHHNHNISEKKIISAVIFNLIITAAEFIGGFLSGSLSLVSDAFHNLSDSLAIFLSYVAFKLTQRASTLDKTFGYKRAEIIAAFVNASILVAISLFIIKEAWNRFQNPVNINSDLMLIIASIGFIGNLLSLFVLKGDSHHNLNIKSAYLHILGDLLSSVGVIIGALMIKYFQINLIDPILSILISVYIIKESFALLKQVLGILMHNTPESTDIREIQKTVEALPLVANIHHVHIWKINDKDIYFECHIDLKEDLRVKEADIFRQSIEEMLADKFGIEHTTIQMEFDSCLDKEIIKQHI